MSAKKETPSVDFHCLIQPPVKKRLTKQKKQSKLEWSPFITKLSDLYDESQGANSSDSQIQPKSSE